MGGSVAVQVAANKTLPTLAGLVVVDVVEVCFLIEKSQLFLTWSVDELTKVLLLQGTAVASLIHMQKILSNRMQHFPSIEKAVRNF